jgi:transposase
MSTPASEDLRRRVVQAYLAGEGTYEEIAQRFVVGPASVDRWLNAFRTRGSYAPKPHAGGKPSKIDKEGLLLLAKLVEDRPDVTLAELAAEYEQRRDVKLALSMVCRALQKLGLNRKKR